MRRAVQDTAGLERVTERLLTLAGPLVAPGVPSLPSLEQIVRERERFRIGRVAHLVEERRDVILLGRELLGGVHDRMIAAGSVSPSSIHW